MTARVFGEPTEGEKRAREASELRASERAERERTVEDSLPSPSEQATAEPTPDSRPDPKTALANLLSGPSIKPAPSDDTEATFSEAADTETAADAELEAQQSDSTPSPVIAEAAGGPQDGNAASMYVVAGEGEHAGDGSRDFEDAEIEEDTDLLADAEAQDEFRQSRQGPGPVSELLDRLRSGRKAEAENEGDQNANGIPDALDADRAAEDDDVDQDGDGEVDQLENAAPDESQVDADGDGTPDQLDTTPEGGQQAPQRVQRRELDLDNTEGQQPRREPLDLDAAREARTSRVDDAQRERRRTEPKTSQLGGLLASRQPSAKPNRRGRGMKEQRAARRGR